MNRVRAPGMAAAVAIGGQIVWSDGFGYANVEQHSPALPISRFRIGSVSKMIAIGALARLYEQGRVDLDAPVQRYVPSFPKKEYAITTRMLAGHLAGVRHYKASDPMYSGRHYNTVREGLAIFENDPLLFEPGTSYLYSSYGFNLLGAVIEGASDREYNTIVRELVLEPLGLRHTGPDQNADIVDYRTGFYERDTSGRLRNARYVDNSYKWAGGGYSSTVEDLARFGSAFSKPGFLKRETLELLFTSQRLKSGKETGVGIGWRIGVDRTGARVYSHGGTVEGGRAMLVIYPDSKIVAVLLANMIAPFGEKEAHELASLFRSSQ